MATIKIDSATANASHTHKGTGETATIRWNGGSGTFFADGTWDTATATLEWSINGTNWVSFASGLTADGRQDFTIGAGVFVRVTVSSVGASTDLRLLVSEVGLNRG
jgi:hypothetical protein